MSHIPMLSPKKVAALISSKEQLTDYVVFALVRTIEIGIRKLQMPDTSANAVAVFGDFLRKVRSDLLGSNETAQLPTMMVNIALSPSNTVSIATPTAPAASTAPVAPAVSTALAAPAVREAFIEAITSAEPVEPDESEDPLDFEQLMKTVPPPRFEVPPELRCNVRKPDDAKRVDWQAVSADM